MEYMNFIHELTLLEFKGIRMFVTEKKMKREGTGQ